MKCFFFITKCFNHDKVCFNNRANCLNCAGSQRSQHHHGDNNVLLRITEYYVETPKKQRFHRSYLVSILFFSLSLGAGASSALHPKVAGP